MDYNRGKVTSKLVQSSQSSSFWLRSLSGLSQVLLTSLIGLSQVFLRSFSGSSQVSLRFFSGLSQVSLISFSQLSDLTWWDRRILKYFLLLKWGSQCMNLIQQHCTVNCNGPLWQLRLDYQITIINFHVHLPYWPDTVHNSI